MLLLHSQTFEFKRIYGDLCPPYAILSHTWGDPDDEVSYQDMRSGSAESKAGYSKIQQCGKLAALNGLDYFWIDTCCIDKSSRAELSEAINSMYKWYQDATVCYAYLSDVPTNALYRPESEVLNDLQQSKYFTRGWTLQELLAPAKVIFLSQNWQEIGEKVSLINCLRKATGIHSMALRGTPMSSFSVAARMSWASKRQTTRVEDMAYSLMGIFEVNMPLLYGEREKAFIRLQEEIIKSSDDQSLFAWKDPSISAEAFTGLLANSPSNFADSSGISYVGSWTGTDVFYMTQKGLRVELFLIPEHKDHGIYRASLDCVPTESDKHTIGIHLKLISGSTDSWGTNPKVQFARIKSCQMDWLTSREKNKGAYRALHVRQSYTFIESLSQIPRLSTCFQINHSHARPTTAYPGFFNPQIGIFYPVTAAGQVGGLFFDHDKTRYMLILGLTKDGHPWVKIPPTVSLDPFHDWASYKVRGKEKAECYGYIGFSGLGRSVTVKASVSGPTNFYKTPVFVVSCLFDVPDPKQTNLLE